LAESGCAWAHAKMLPKPNQKRQIKESAMCQKDFGFWILDLRFEILRFEIWDLRFEIWDLRFEI
jgi:hypothetical protein